MNPIFLFIGFRAYRYETNIILLFAAVLAGNLILDKCSHFSFIAAVKLFDKPIQLILLIFAECLQQAVGI
ncbi:hypothetical protein D3C78_1152760 [compost metagenome]